MRAILIDDFGGRDRMRLADDAADPLVGPDTVLVRVRAAGVNPVDHLIREGALTSYYPHVLPIVLGWDAAGVVEAVGPAVTAFAPGDEVYGYFRKDFVRDGTYAELTNMRDTALARKPATLSFEEAAGVPLAGLTALQTLRDALELQRGETILIVGASGGVGSFAVQIAKAGGARVIGVASARNADYVRELGADAVVDYAAPDALDAVRDAAPDGLEAIADLSGGELATRAIELLIPGRGRLASIIAPPDPAPLEARGCAARYLFVRPDAEDLRTLAAMADAGELRVHLDAVFALDEAADALARVEEGHPRGKVVLRVG
ncbi:MAG: hypothetical protein QOC78_4237 [Solirubrobacteraceae bacterium]|jgi:NADPH:quinone reductase-like Zn-dependent oxidoreductase|nr:hypothetical protein [Solirubrobacteraceae bacterium]